MAGLTPTTPPRVPLARVGRTALLLTPVAITARGVAFAVPVVIAHLFGVTGVTDAFFYALAFPTFIMVIVANALGTITTPIMADVQEEAPDELGRFVGGAALSSGAVALGTGILILVTLTPLMPVITRFPADTGGLALIFVAELLPFMALVGASVILRAACEVRSAFVPAAISPMLRGGCVMAALFLLHGTLGPHTLPAALVLGQAVELTWYLTILIRTGVVPVPRLLPDPRLRRAARDALPLLGGEVMVALNVVLDKAFAGTLAEGSVSLLEYADRTRFIPQTLLESTLVPVAFATWANLAARGDRAGAALQIDQSLRWVAALTAAPLAGLYIGRYVLTEMLFHRGAFEAEHVTGAADAFGWYVPGLWSMLLGTVAMRAHVVERRLRLILVLGVASVVLNTTLNLLLIGPMGINGLALASSLVWVFVPACYLAALAPTLRGVARLRSWMPVLALTLAAAAVALSVELTVGAPRSFADPVLWSAALVCFGLLGAAAIVTRPPVGSPA